MENNQLRLQDRINILEDENSRLREELCKKCGQVQEVCNLCPWYIGKEEPYRDEGARVD